MSTFGRREFLGSLFSPKKEKKVLLRPPYVADPSLFQTQCKDCFGDCVGVCDEGIIRRDIDGSPFLVFERSGCTFCDKCAQSCTKGVLVLDAKQKYITRNIKIEMTSCISWQKVVCYNCKDVCGYKAVEFLGMFRPEINDKCVGCGLCIPVCPTKAIKIGG